jgi:hypothetical protein
LLHAPVVNQAVGCKLPVPKVFQNLALLLSFAERCELANPQLLEFQELFFSRRNLSDAHAVTGQLELKFGSEQTAAEILLGLAESPQPFRFGFFPMLACLYHLPGDDLKP